VLLGAALAESAPIVILHLTRPPIVVPDRAKLGIASHFEAAQGAYLVRDYTPGEPRGGTIVAQGTSAMVSLCQVLPELDARRLNVKIVYAASAEMFARQPAAVREGLLSAADRIDSTFITTQSRGSMGDWTFHEGAAEYALSSDWDNRWRTGGTVEEVIDEAMLSPEAIQKGIERFVRERPARLGRQEAALTQALRESEGTPQPA
jgi:transketolase